MLRVTLKLDKIHVNAQGESQLADSETAKNNATPNK